LFGKEVLPKQKKVSKEVLAGVFDSIFRSSKTTAQDLVRMMYSECEAAFDFLSLCLGERTGHKISMFFNPHRYDTPTIEKRSIVDAINNFPTQMDGLARAALFKLGKCPNRELLYQILQLAINASQYVNEFPPAIARRHFLSFNAKRVLDPCGGWGGRMIGAASVGAYYEAWEPATKTYKGLLQLGKWLKRFETGFEFCVHPEPFEDAEAKDRFDLAYTSPPYYDTERYSEEPSNSFNRYPTFEEWLEGFYLPMVRKAVKTSRQGLIINIGTRRYDLKTPLEKRYRVREIPSGLSGAGGLGRKRKGKESFFHVT